MLRRRQDVGDLVVRAGTAFEEYRQGVPGAIDTLVRLVSPLLWHTARQCGLTAAESEDVVQQTFLSLVRSKDSVSDPLAVVRWLTVEPAPAGLAGAVEQRQTVQRGTDRRRSAARSVRGAHGRADRSTTPALGDGRRTQRTLPASCWP